MLTGLGPALAVILVVAADQGWQAQSSEHLEAVDALGLEVGMLVLTRCGLADDTRIAQVREQALTTIASTSLGRVCCVETDAVSGCGVDELRSALDELVAAMPRHDANGGVRMWIDRSFTIKGTGTVVTGTLSAGTLRVGDEVSIEDANATVRSLQVLGRSCDEVGPVSRCAVGLRGPGRDAAPRGTALLAPPGGLHVRAIDVRRETGRPWREASGEVSVHVGTAAVPARLRPFDDVTARLTLSSPLPLRLGDRIIVRDDSAARIHGGATVLGLDPAPLRRRGDGAARATKLTGRRAARADDIVVDRGHVSTAWLDAAGASGWRDWPASLPAGDDFGVLDGVAMSGEQARGWQSRLRALVDADAQDALSAGLAIAVAQRELGVPTLVVTALAQAANLVVGAGRIRGPQHGHRLGAAQNSLEHVRARLLEAPFDAPEADDLASLGLGAREIAAAAERGLVLRLRAQPADIVLLPDAPARDAVARGTAAAVHDERRQAGFGDDPPRRHPAARTPRRTGVDATRRQLAPRRALSVTRPVRRP